MMDKSLLGLCRLGVVLVGLVGLLVVTGSAHAVLVQQGTITQTGGAASDSFGWSVALSSDGNTAIVGAAGDNADQGSATIYTRSGTTWSQQQTITQTGGAAGDRFGRSVALSSDGNTAIVGAYGDDVGGSANQGSASIFTRSGTTWTQQQTITQTDGAASDLFGSSVALSSDGNTAIVGAYFDNDGSIAYQGSASIFTRSGTTWTQQQTITQTGGAANDQFGGSVALSSDGNTAIVGAPYDDAGSGLGQGSATIFTRTSGTWTQQQTITQTGGAANDWFGVSVALSSDGNTAIVGAYGDNSAQGSATIYTRSGTTWSQQQTITQSDGAATDFFGGSVALSSDGNTAIVGAYGDNSDQGSATIYTRSGTTWSQQQTITQTVGAATDWFGGSVALSSDGNTAIVGANGDDVGSIADQGSATIFVLGVVPGVPTSVSASSGANTQSMVSWTAPSDTGNSTITGYTVTASPGGATCSWTSGALSCTVTGLTNGTNYTFTVKATNAAGTSAASASSSTITPTAAPATAAPATPVNVKWTKPSIKTPLVATFTAVPGTTYLITATLTKAAKTLRIATTKGTCKIKSGKATCAIKLKTRGTWSVVITPKKNGSLGKPVKKTVKI